MSNFYRWIAQSYRAVVGWCFCAKCNYWSLGLKYYKTMDRANRQDQTHRKTFKGVLGCPPMNRGRHFDRKAR